MTNAIEVLKRLKDNPCGLVDIHEVGMDSQSSWTEANISNELEQAIDEALLALERVEEVWKLVECLEKEIALYEEPDSDMYEWDKGFYDCLKKVLERVGEQK